VAQGVTFRDAGTLDGSVTSFAGYAATLISDVAVRADALEQQQSFQSGLVDSLEYKAKSGSGVNLDQEVSDLMMFEQAYSASARVIGIVQKMFEALQQAIG
jgi:flagellar hook-associated protein 1 FlgK